MSPLEQILHNQKKQSKQLAEIMKRLNPTEVMNENTDWISAEQASKLTGYKKDSLRKMGLTRKFKQSGRKPSYSLKELKQRNLIN